MAYTLTNSSNTISSDTTDANGVRWVTFLLTETWTNNEPPFDFYYFNPPSRTVTTSPGHGSSPLCPFREVTDPYRSSGSAWPNPFTVRSVGLGDMNFNFTGTPANISIKSTSTGSYEFVAAPDDMMQENFTVFENMQELQVADKDELVDSAHLNEGLN